MSKQQDEEFDDLFKKKLEDPIDEIGFREEDWNALENMLDERKKRKGIAYWPLLVSSIAALLLIFFGLWLFQPKVNRNNAQNKLHAVNMHPKANVLPKVNDEKTPADNAEKNASGNKQTSTVKENYAVKGNKNKLIIGGGTIPVLASTGNSIAKHYNNSIVKQRDTNNIEKAINDRSYMGTLMAVSEKPGIRNEDISSQQINSTDISKTAIKPISGSIYSSNIKSKTNTAFRPRYALSVLAAPDINGVGSFQQSKVGTNLGLLFSAGISKKFTVSTGALYSSKPYEAGYNNYNFPYHFNNAPSSVTADCQMLDIPLNVNYQVYHKKQNKFSIGTGLSSYIMLHEAYTFNYNGYNTSGPSHYTVPNSGKYFFGIYNLNINYERQLNSKVGLTVQPYLKLPLAAIGYSQVRLQTTGVAVGLNWNLNTPKP
jgi:hypothetical protein